MVRRRQFVAGAVGMLVAPASRVRAQGDASGQAPDAAADEAPPPWQSAEIEPDAAVYISPTGTGSGLSWADAAPFEAIADLAARLGPGGSINLLAGAVFDAKAMVRIATGGEPGAPLSIRGLTRDGKPGRAEIVGDRRPWREARSERDAIDASEFGGSTLFRLADKASHIDFRDLFIRDAGLFLDMGGLTGSHIGVRDVGFRNLRDGILTDGESSVSDVTIERFSGRGFSKKAIRFHGKCRDWRIIDCELDSAWQYGDNFAVGIEAHDEAHGLEILGGFTINCMDNQGGDQDEYWNADGVASERGNYDIAIRDHRSAGNTDAGYDLKSEATLLERCVSEDNKRNFRLWGGIGFDPIELRQCQSEAPAKRGGSGSVNHIWLSGAERPGEPAASVVMIGGTMRGGGNEAIHADGGNVAVHLVDVELALPAGAELFAASQDTSRIIVGSTRDPEPPAPVLPASLSVIEGVSSSLTLPDEPPATWRVTGSGSLVPSLDGSKISLSAGDEGQREDIVIQMRDSAGRPTRFNLSVEVIANPVKSGAVLALEVDGKARSIVDTTGLNLLELSDGADFTEDGFRFTGKSSYFEVPASENFIFAGPFALEARLRINRDKVSLPSDIISLWKTSGHDRSFRLGLTEAGEIAFFWSTSGRAEEDSRLVGPALDGAFHDIVVDRGPSGIIRLYVDGAMVARTEAGVGKLHKSPAPLRVSGRPDDKFGSQGILQSLVILNGAALCDSDEGCKT